MAYVIVDFMILHQTEWGFVFMVKIAQFCAKDTEILSISMRHTEVSACQMCEHIFVSIPVIRCDWKNFSNLSNPAPYVFVFK